ncbi:MAG TPA: DUF4157 domain-containing protein [Thermoanaerobaculia bacterium]|nr:DUF4157 domain-containing protein [Thermoanaerobaculia bacterium]
MGGRVIQGWFPHGPRARLAAQPRRSAAGTAFALQPGAASFPGGVGQRLPAVLQARMEALFGTRFDAVRVHVGREAPGLGALAFTFGTDLYFAPGQYNPSHPHGQRLLAHELAHVVQQRTGRVRNPFGSGIAVVQDPGLEAEAERMAMRAVTPSRSAPSRPVALPRHAGRAATVQRMEVDASSSSSSSSGGSTHGVEVYQGSVDPRILAEVKAIVDAAASAGGGATFPTHESATRLEGFMKGEGAPKVSSQDTFAIGGSSYFPGVFTLVTVGSNPFQSAMEQQARKAYTEPDTLSVEKLGGRDSCTHGEMAVISEYPGVQALRTTQDCCLFCYGLLHKRRYYHQPLRHNVWPQAWRHDYLGFKLTNVSVTSFARTGDILAITWQGKTRYYRVDPP